MEGGGGLAWSKRGSSRRKERNHSEGLRQPPNHHFNLDISGESLGSRSEENRVTMGGSSKMEREGDNLIKEKNQEVPLIRLLRGRNYGASY